MRVLVYEDELHVTILHPALTHNEPVRLLLGLHTPLRKDLRDTSMSLTRQGGAVGKGSSVDLALTRCPVQVLSKEITRRVDHHVQQVLTGHDVPGCRHIHCCTQVFVSELIKL